MGNQSVVVGLKEEIVKVWCLVPQTGLSNHRTLSNHSNTNSSITRGIFLELLLLLLLLLPLLMLLLIFLLIFLLHHAPPVSVKLQLLLHCSLPGKLKETNISIQQARRYDFFCFAEISILN